MKRLASLFGSIWGLDDDAGYSYDADVGYADADVGYADADADYSDVDADYSDVDADIDIGAAADEEDCYMY